MVDLMTAAPEAAAVQLAARGAVRPIPLGMTG